MAAFFEECSKNQGSSIILGPFPQYDEQEEEAPGKRHRKSGPANPASDDYNTEHYAYYNDLSLKEQRRIAELEKLMRGQAAAAYDGGGDGKRKRGKGKKAGPQVVVPPRFRLLDCGLPDAVKAGVLARAECLFGGNGCGSSSEKNKLDKWLQALLRIPFGRCKRLPIDKGCSPGQICDFVKQTRERLDSNIHGHAEAKQQIIRTLAKWISNPNSRGNVIGIEGPMGCGKTTLVKACIAEALELPLAVIQLGGLSDASVLSGHSYTYEGSNHGILAGALMKTRCMNPVILLDELDKVCSSSKGEEVTNLLIHLTDSTQNDMFFDHYFPDVPIDFSKALMVFTYNDGAAINPILRDRMTCIRTAGYTLADKQRIAAKHLLPDICKEHGYEADAFAASDATVASIVNRVETEAGVRNLKRALADIVSNVNLQCYIEGGDRRAKVVIEEALVRKYVKSASADNVSLSHIYL